MKKNLSGKRIERVINNVKTTMSIENMEMPALAEVLGRKMLNGEITREKAIEAVKEKYGLRS